MPSYNGKIVLDLTKSLSSGAISSGSFLQTHARQKLDDLLNEFKGRKAEPKAFSIFDFPRYNNTIFVSGQRGAGKTTFLKTYLSELNNKGGDIYPVALIDPTLVHTNQPILVEIITCLKRAFERQLVGCKNSDKYHAFREQLSKLAEGLKLLRIKKEDVDQDASWFLNKAIKNADSGQSLEENLYQLIDVILGSLDKKLLVIAIDDVDNDTSKARDVLETIRKYLSHPQIVIVVSGDLKIYSHIVKTKKLEELSAESLIGDEKTNELVEHLEQQYLVKIFPAEQRIHLKTLQGILYDETKEVYLKTNFTKQTVNIIEALEGLLTNCLKIDKVHIDTYRDFIFEQPIRTILQLFKNVDYRNSNTENISNFSNFIKNSYIGLLQKEGINSDKLLSTTLHQNDIGLADFKVNSKYGELETGYYSRTDGEQDSYNVSQLFLASVKSNFLNSSKSPIGAAFQLIIATGATSNVYLNFVKAKLKDKASEKDYIDFIGMNRYTPTTSLVPHFSPFLLDITDTIKLNIMGGVARLPRSSKPADTFIPTIDKLYKKPQNSETIRIKTLNDLLIKQDERSVSLIEFVSAKTITMSSHSSITKNEGRDYISCYLLLSVLGELLNAKGDKVKLNNLISKFGSIQTFGSPAFVDVEAQGSDGKLDIDFDDKDVNTTVEDNTNNDELSQLLDRWTRLSGNGTVSVLLVGKIWSRIHYTLNSVSELARTRKLTLDTPNSISDPDESIKLPSHFIFLGGLMTRWVTGIINSALIEESRYKPVYDERLVNSLSKAKNVASASNVFVQNLKAAFNSYDNDEEKIKECLPLTHTLLTCPLLWPYFLAEIGNNTTVKSTLKSMISSNFKDSIDPSDFSKLLDDLFQQKHDGLKFVSRLPVLGWKS